MNRGARERFLAALEASDLRADAWLYVCAAAAFVAEAGPLAISARGEAASQAAAIAAILLHVLTLASPVVILLRFSARFEGLLRPLRPPAPDGRAWRRAATWIVALAVGYCALLASEFVTVLLDPRFVASHDMPVGPLHGLLAILAGPMEEAMRWCMILGAFFVTRRLVPRASALAAFGAGVVLSALLFGLGHVGNFPGHTAETVTVLGASGLVFALFACWTGSFRAAAALHSMGNAIALLADVDPTGRVGTLVAAAVVATGLLGLGAAAWRRFAARRRGLDREIRASYNGAHPSGNSRLENRIAREDREQ